jgi:hypothetical protein
MDARNNSIMRRQLAGRKSTAALEWLLKRQQERQHVEQEIHRVRGCMYVPAEGLHAYLCMLACMLTSHDVRGWEGSAAAAQVQGRSLYMGCTAC